MTLRFRHDLPWEDLVRGLQSSSSQALARSSHGPVFPLHSIRFADLDVPTALRELIREVMTSTRVVDRSERASDIGDDRLGAMRQIHANDPMYLPRFAVPTSGLTDRARLYEEYVGQNKKHSAGRGGGNDTTGYVEYTAGTNDMYNRGGRGRIVFDYVHSRIYFTPVHYEPWTVPPTGLGETFPKAVEGNFISPWFWITDVTHA